MKSGKFIFKQHRPNGCRCCRMTMMMMV